MNIRIISDLHTEFWNPSEFEKTLNQIIPYLETDRESVLCLAGDCGTAATQKTTYSLLFKLLSKRFKAVIYVMGNHFWYNSQIWGKESLFWKNNTPPNVFVLDDSYKIIDDVMFFGSTLWTSMNKSNPIDMFNAKQSMRDYDVIWKDCFVVRKDCSVSSTYRINKTLITPEDTIARFHYSRQAILAILKEYKNHRSVIITHHAPSGLCVDAEYINDPMTPAYMSELGQDIIQFEPNVWCYGHMHHHKDFMLGNTRIVNNAYGYRNVQVNINKYYDPNFVITL